MLALVAALVLAGAACGGGDDEAAPTATEAAATEAVASDAAPAAEDVDPATAGDVLAGDCADEQAISGAFNSMNDDGRTADEKRAAMQQALDYFESSADTAPAELAEDFALVNDYFEALFGVMDKIDFDTTKLVGNAEVAQEFAGLAADFDPAQLPVALGNVSRYIAESCN